MRSKLRTEAGRTVYKMRKAIVEPVFGQIKEQFAINHQQDYCLRAPVRTPVLQTAESALAKRYARHTPSATAIYRPNCRCVLR